jgi:phage tail sheath gpL-like
MLAPQNPDVPSSYMIPGVYVALDLSGNGASLNSAEKRALIVGYKLASGSKPKNTPVRVIGQSQANAFAGRGSDAARHFAAFQSQIGAGQVDTWMLLLEEPTGGTAATRLVKIVGATAAVQDAVNFRICGYTGSVLIAAGDTPTIVAAALADEINAIADIPVTASPAADTVTLTYRHKGVVGNDLPLLFEIPGDSTLKVSCGTLTYATNVTGAGSAVVNVGPKTYTVALTDGWTPTQVAAAVAAAINAEAGPVTAEAALGVVTLFYAPERDVRRVTASIVTSTGVTVTVACGTAGAGTPTLTTALAVGAAMKAFKVWSSAIADTGSLGSMYNHIKTYANGLHQKGQVLFAASAAALADSGDLVTTPAPALTSAPRGHIGWCPNAPVQAHELAARHAARVCVEDFHPRNYDGEPLRSGTATVPLPVPHVADRPGPDEIQAAMRSYYLTPYVVNGDEELTIMRSRTTSNDSDERLWDTSLIMTADFTRYDYGVFLAKTFKGKSLKKSGEVKTPNVVTVDDIADAVISRMFAHEDADFLDGAEELKKAVRSNINVISPTRADVFIPFRPPVPLHIITPTVGLV